MKVVLFCGGEGTRIRDHAGSIPKPMVHIGYRPMLWHVMKYYAHYGHKDFILCLGHGADHIKDYFVNYDETVSNDFVMTNGGEVNLLASDIHDWRITFVDTGHEACVGERLMAVRPFLEDEEVFLANYADGVSDAPLDDMIRFHQENGKAVVFVGVGPNYTSHVIQTADDGTVITVKHVTEMGMRINGGFFVMSTRVFDYIKEGEDLLNEPFQRMVAAGDLSAYIHDGFWACMDTFKEKRMLDDIYKTGDAPWEIWNREANAAGDGVTGTKPRVDASS